MDLPESPELDSELRQLRTWTCMLDELQHTAAIVQMLQETSLAQVRFLMEMLRQREVEFSIIHDLTSEDSPLPSEWVERRQSSSPSNTTITDTSAACSCSDSLAPFNDTIHMPVSRSSTLLSPPPGFPAPILSPPSIPKSQCTNQKFAFSDKTKAKIQTDSQIQLVRLTTFASRPFRIHKKRPRKIPHFPRDESDPRWLLNWLHSLRLHKYAPSLQGLSPDGLLELSEDELIERGIGSIGARKKLIVAFEEAKQQIAEARKSD
ncbi:hypothetical protein IFR05_000528 [Cadophora sp. M221]|nr:hypothetical protein IFR05_000528 [Cadophora sp. M221]